MLQVRQSKGKVLVPVLQEAGCQSGHNIQSQFWETKGCISPLGLSTCTRNAAAIHTALLNWGVEDERQVIQNPDTLLLQCSSFFLYIAFPCCFKFLIRFRSSAKVDSDSLCRLICCLFFFFFFFLWRGEALEFLTLPFLVLFFPVPLLFFFFSFEIFIYF